MCALSGGPRIEKSHFHSVLAFSVPCSDAIHSVSEQTGQRACGITPRAFSVDSETPVLLFQLLSCQVKAVSEDEAGCYRVLLHAGPMLGALSSLTFLVTL